MDQDLEVEVKDSVLGALVPQHLLKYNNGDQELQCYFRKLLEENYKKGIVKVGLGRCSSCYHPLTIHDHPRVCPGMKRSHRVTQLMEKAKTQQLSKYQNFIVRRFLESSTQLKVQCPGCGYVNKSFITSRRDCLAAREKLLLESAVNQEVPEVVIETPTLSKKKRKKMRRKQKLAAELLQRGSLLTVQELQKSEEMSPFSQVSASSMHQAHNLSDQSTPFSLHREDQDSSNGAKASKTLKSFPTYSTPTSSNIGKLSTPNVVQTLKTLKSTSLSAHLLASVSSKKPTAPPSAQTWKIPKQSYSSFNPMPKSATQVPNMSHHQTKAGQPAGKKKSFKHKELQEFLKGNQSTSKAKSSLQDFLSSL